MALKLEEDLEERYGRRLGNIPLAPATGGHVGDQPVLSSDSEWSGLEESSHLRLGEQTAGHRDHRNAYNLYRDAESGTKQEEDGGEEGHTPYNHYQVETVIKKEEDASGGHCWHLPGMG